MQSLSQLFLPPELTGEGSSYGEAVVRLAALLQQRQGQMRWMPHCSHVCLGIRCFCSFVTSRREEIRGALWRLLPGNFPLQELPDTTAESQRLCQLAMSPGTLLPSEASLWQPGEFSQTSLSFQIFIPLSVKWKEFTMSAFPNVLHYCEEQMRKELCQCSEVKTASGKADPKR